MPETYHLFNGLIMFSTCLLHSNTMSEVAKHHTNVYVCIYWYINTHINKVGYIYSNIQCFCALFQAFLPRYIVALHSGIVRICVMYEGWVRLRGTVMECVYTQICTCAYFMCILNIYTFLFYVDIKYMHVPILCIYYIHFPVLAVLHIFPLKS